MASNFMERLAEAPLLVDGAYFLELERRGLGSYATEVPMAVLQNPEGLLELHREFVIAGADVLQAFTWGVKPMELGQEKELHRTAVELARKAAGPDRFVVGTLSGSGSSRRSRYSEWMPGDWTSMMDSERVEVQSFFERRVDQQMAVGVDAFFCESYSSVETVSLALPFIKEARVPAVIMFVYHESEMTRDGYTPVEAAKRLEDQGADVVGVQCMRPWRTMRHIVRQIRKAVSIPVISQPSGYELEPGEVYCRPIHIGSLDARFQSKKVEPKCLSRFEMAEYAREAKAIGVNVIGSCCGSMPYHVRAMAETLGKPVALPDLDRGYRAAPVG